MSDTGDALREIAARLEALGYTLDAERLMEEAEAIDPTPIPTFAERLANALSDDDDDSINKTAAQMYLSNANVAIDLVIDEIYKIQARPIPSLYGPITVAGVGITDIRRALGLSE